MHDNSVKESFHNNSAKKLLHNNSAKESFHNNSAKKLLHNNSFKKLFRNAPLYLAAVLLFTALTFLFGGQTAQAAEGINVEYHSQQEIRAYFSKHNISVEDTADFDKQPSLKAPYSIGALSSATQNKALDTLNAIRYIAGIGYDVKLSDEYIKLAQSGAFINALNNSLSHYPARPSVFDSTNPDTEAIYRDACTGCGKSNIAWTSWKTGLSYNIAMQWMADDDAGNIPMVGHRRWLLNPYMGKTGFGACYTSSGSTYANIYAFDRSNTDAGYYGVAWPAQNTPVELFENYFPWSISMGTTVDKDSVKVTLTRTKDQKTWKFSASSADGFFNVDNVGYGQIGCIIFRPDDITYADGDSFHVEITGCMEPISYDVNFFSVYADNTSKDSDKTATGALTEKVSSKQKTTKFTSVKVSGTSLKLKWKKVSSKITGYEIWLSTSKTFDSGSITKVRIKPSASVSYTFKDLTPGKKYYIRIRTYKETSKKITFSKYSKLSSAKIKK